MLFCQLIKFIFLVFQTFVNFHFELDHSFEYLCIVVGTDTKHRNHGSKNFDPIEHIILKLTCLLPAFALRFMHSEKRLRNSLHLFCVMLKPDFENFQTLLESSQVLPLNSVVSFQAIALIGFRDIDDGQYFFHFNQYIGNKLALLIIILVCRSTIQMHTYIKPSESSPIIASQNELQFKQPKITQQKMIDVLTLVITIIGSLLSLIVDIYFIILYTHKQEPMCRPISIFCKILILITLLQVELQPLFLLFDVSSSRTYSANFTILWFAVYFSILVNIAFLKPLASSLYEADEQDPCWKIILWAIVEVLITMAVFGVFLGIGWLFWGRVFIPYEEISLEYIPIAQLIQGNQVMANETIEITTTIPCFLIGLLCLIGYPILACCGAFGMTALPFSLIMDFKNRPKWRRTNQARAITEELKNQTVMLIKQSDRVRRSINRVEYIDGWFSQRKKNQELQTQLTNLQNKIEKHRDFYELFKLELDMANVNPWVFILKLAAGILGLIFTPLWLVQILLAQLVVKESVFLDKFLVFMEVNNATFVSIAFILLLTLYMILAVLKGIFFVSESLPFIKIHPMVQGKTWLNSFMFQTNIAVLASTALVHLMVTTFPTFLRGGDIALMMGSILQGMLFTGVFIRNKVFIYMFLIMSVLGSFFVGFKMFCLNHKSDQMLRIEQIREKLFGKDKKDKKISIEMTEMNLKDDKKKKDKNKGIKVSKVDLSSNSNIPSKQSIPSNIQSGSNISSNPKLPSKSNMSGKSKRIKLQFA